MMLESAYRLTSHAGESFFAAIVVDENDKMKVLSTRDGTWAPETLWTVADLFAPWYDFNEWDRDRVDQKDLEPPLDIEVYKL